MTTNQEGRQAAIRDSTSTAYGVAADWHALFDDAGISAGTFNERLLAWINAELSASYSNLVSAMQAYAEDAGYDGWEDMATLVLAMNGAETLLDGETQGLAFDFTDHSALIIDTGTPANNYDSTGIVSSGSLVGPSGKLTYTSPSNKLTMQSDGYIKYQAHNILQYSSLDGVSAGSPGTAPTGWTWFSSGTVTNSALSNDAITLTIESGARVFAYRAQTGVIGQTYCFAAYVTIDSGTVTPADILAVVSTTPINTSFTYQGSSTTSSTALSGSGWLVYRFDASVSATITCRFGLGATSAGSGAQGVTVSKPHLYRYPANTDYIKTTSAAKYALPLEYDTSGSCLGLLVEEARTNSHVYSNTFSNAAWSKVGSYEQNATGLDGLTSAWTLTDGVTGSPLAFRFSQAPTLTANVYSHSIYAKAGTNSWLRILVDATASGSVNAFYNLSTGELGTVSGSGITASITSVGNGWYRCTAIATMTAAACRVYFQMCTADNQAGYIGDGTGTMLFQHAQTEQGAFPTSPIITYGAAATRAVDNISIATSAFPASSSVGSVYVYANLSSTAARPYSNFFRMDDGTTSNRVAFYRNNSNTSVGLDYTSGAVGQGPVTRTATSLAAATKLSGAWAANDLAFCVDGGTVGTDTSATMGGTYTTLLLGRDTTPTTDAIMTGHIKAISYVPRRKTDAELQAETT